MSRFPGRGARYAVRLAVAGVALASPALGDDHEAASGFARPVQQAQPVTPGLQAPPAPAGEAPALDGPEVTPRLQEEVNPQLREQVAPKLREQAVPRLKEAVPARPGGLEPARVRAAITRVVPASAAPGARVRIEGRGFGPRAGGEVRLGDRVMAVQRWSDRGIVAVVPPGAGPGAAGLAVYRSGANRPLATARFTVAGGAASLAASGAAAAVEPSAQALDHGGFSRKVPALGGDDAEPSEPSGGFAPPPDEDADTPATRTPLTLTIAAVEIIGSPNPPSPADPFEPVTVTTAALAVIGDATLVVADDESFTPITIDTPAFEIVGSPTP